MFSVIFATSENLYLEEHAHEFPAIPAKEGIKRHAPPCF